MQMEREHNTKGNLGEKEKLKRGKKNEREKNIRKFNKIRFPFRSTAFLKSFSNILLGSIFSKQ